MKSSVLIIAALLMLAKPAAAMSVDHDSNYADSSGSSRFTDPDDQLGSSQFGTLHLGNASSSDSSSNNSGVTFGMFANGGSNNGQVNPSTPGFAMQSCLSPVCQH